MSSTGWTVAVQFTCDEGLLTEKAGQQAGKAMKKAEEARQQAGKAMQKAAEAGQLAKNVRTAEDVGAGKAVKKGR